MSIPRSKTGWLFALAYGAFAAYLVARALTCIGWVCDLVALPATVPFGLVYLALLKLLDPIFYFGSITDAPFRDWYFIAPTVAVNALLYYGLGASMARFVARFRQRRA